MTNAEKIYEKNFKDFDTTVYNEEDRLVKQACLNAINEALTIPIVTRSNNIKEVKTIIINSNSYMYEDELPEMTDKQYDKWYKTSFVNKGVRIGKVVITV